MVPARHEAALWAEALSGIEFENGSIYREESDDMAASIRAGKLDEKRSAAS